MRFKTLQTLIFSFFFNFAVAKEVPNLKHPVLDEVGLLTQKQKNMLNKTLTRLYQNDGPSIAVYITSSLEGESLEDFSIKVADKWKLGNKKRDNGVLFLISTTDRKFRLEVGKGLEGDITDLYSGRLLQTCQKYFGQGKFGDGILFVVGSLLKKLGVSSKDFAKKRQRGNTLNIFLLIIFAVISLLLPRRRRTHLYYGGGGGSFGGGSFGGGSFGGGGGGFSGGGASGSW